MQSDTESEVVGNYSVTKACFFLHQRNKVFCSVPDEFIPDEKNKLGE
jgi:hypothetical protein